MAVSANSSRQKGEIEEEQTTGDFRRFDVVADHSDHHYAATNPTNKGNNNKINGSDCFTNSSSMVHKKIMKEWKILEKDLPESICVRVYERRIDLLRAVIVGPAGTPYQDGLFFFDLAFPPDYPTHPPQVHYRSFGLRLNPNLYANGHVCLSLLNTWVGNKNEKWNPSASTVLQLLVSIQGLVLNEKPYFNEPGIGIIPGRVKKSIAYSENVFVLSCRTMLYLLRRPPKNFEHFVAVHFRERAGEILTVCNAYINGLARVGCYGANGSSVSSSSINVSTKFKAALNPLYDELFAAFTKNGASLGHFVEQVRRQNETASSNAAKVKKQNKRRTTTTTTFRAKVVKKTKLDFKKVIGRIKNILGLKKDGKSDAKTKRIKGKTCE